MSKKKISNYHKFYRTLIACRSQLLKNKTKYEKFIEDIVHSMGIFYDSQAIIGNFIVDILLPDKKLIIEVDGDFHSEHPFLERDKFRTKALVELGFKVVRIKNKDIFDSREHIKNLILAEESSLDNYLFTNKVIDDIVTGRIVITKQLLPKPKPKKKNKQLINVIQCSKWSIKRNSDSEKPDLKQDYKQLNIKEVSHKEHLYWMYNGSGKKHLNSNVKSKKKKKKVHGR